MFPFKPMHLARKIIQVPRAELTHIASPLENRRMCFLSNRYARAVSVSPFSSFSVLIPIDLPVTRTTPTSKGERLGASLLDTLARASVETCSLTFPPPLPLPFCSRCQGPSTGLDGRLRGGRVARPGGTGPCAWKGPTLGLMFFIFEQVPPPFHFSLGSANDAAGPVPVSILGVLFPRTDQGRWLLSETPLSSL